MQPPVLTCYPPITIFKKIAQKYLISIGVPQQVGHQVVYYIVFWVADYHWFRPFQIFKNVGKVWWLFFASSATLQRVATPRSRTAGLRGSFNLLNTKMWLYWRCIRLYLLDSDSNLGPDPTLSHWNIFSVSMCIFGK